MDKITKMSLLGLLGAAAVVFGIKTFIYGGTEFNDPGDSPLYQSTLTRALDNFKTAQGELVIKEGAPLDDLIQRRQPAVADQGSQYLQSAITFIKQSKFKEAVTYLEAAASLSPNNYSVYSYLAMAYEKLGDKQKAQEAAATAARIKSGGGVQKVGTQPPGTQKPSAKQYAQAGLGMYQQGKYKEAVQYLELAAKLDPKDPEPLHTLGNCYLALGDVKKMVESYEAAVKAAPDNALSYYYLGIAYAHSSQKDKARESYQKAIELNPKDTLAHAELGRLYLADGKTEEAMNEFQFEIDFCKQLIEQKPEDPYVYNRLAQFYLRQNINLEEGLQLATKALGMKEDDPNILAAAAQLEFKVGDKDKANDLIDKAIGTNSPYKTYYEAVKRSFSATPGPVQRTTDPPKPAPEEQKEPEPEAQPEKTE